MWDLVAKPFSESSRRISFATHLGTQLMGEILNANVIIIIAQFWHNDFTENDFIRTYAVGSKAVCTHGAL